MKGATSHHICLLVAIALRITAGAPQQPKGFNEFGASLRIQKPGDASPAKEKESTKADSQEANSTLPIPQNVFKMPTHHHKDFIAVATNGWLDGFLVIYWGVIIGVITIIELVPRLRDGDFITFHQSPREKESSEKSPEAPEEAPTSSGSLLRRSSTSMFLGADDETGKTKDLAPNVWALNLVASHGKALDRHGNMLSPKLVFFAGFIMGIIQLLTLFLVVYDIDPSASPYTETPNSPWKTSPLTVNTMKVVMVFFLGMYVVSEAADAYDNYVLGVALKPEVLHIHRFFVLFIPFFHYFITLSVILAGVSVVLSCQDVPNILYNSMAILFITRVDELFWGFFERTFDIDAEWRVNINESDHAEVVMIKKCIIMFPMLWGFCLLGRAWYRDQMPALVVRENFAF